MWCNFISGYEQMMSQQALETIIWCWRSLKTLSLWRKTCLLKSPAGKIEWICLHPKICPNSNSYRDSPTVNNSNNINHDKMNNNHSATNGGEYTQMYEKCNDLLTKVQNQKHVNNNNWRFFSTLPEINEWSNLKVRKQSSVVHLYLSSVVKKIISYIWCRLSFICAAKPTYGFWQKCTAA